MSVVSSLPFQNDASQNYYPRVNSYPTVGRKVEIKPRSALSDLQEPQLVSKRFFSYISPIQATVLYGAGVGLAIASQWFSKGLFQPDKLITSLAPLRHPAQHIEQQTAIYFQRGLESLVMMALKYKPLQTRLKAYIGASILGYTLASMAQGAQEVWIRREETQIRANLIQQLQGIFKKSLHKKHAADNTLRDWTVQQINKRLLPIGLSSKIQSDTGNLNPQWRFPYEPAHFTFGNKPLDADVPVNYEQTQTTPIIDDLSTSLHRRNMVEKSGAMGLGFISGWLYMGLNRLLQNAHAGNLPNKLSTRAMNGTKHSLLEIVNAEGREALFLMGNKKLLWLVLGLSATAKTGKLLIDGYREVEVTRKHADTELKYQTHNWLDLDPAFRNMTEQEAVKNALYRLDHLISGYQQGQVPAYAVQHLANMTLMNIGRESAPKYFQMTPGVSLAPARG